MFTARYGLKYNTTLQGQAVSRRPVTAEARFQSQASPGGICGGHSVNGTGFSPSTSALSCQCIVTGAQSCTCVS